MPVAFLQKHFAQQQRDLAWKTFSNLITTGSLAILAVTGLCMVYTENILGLMGRHITDPLQLALTARMTRIILPAQIFFYWGALLMAVQYAEKRFFIPALAPLVYNAGIILGGVLLSPILGIEGFAWGVLIGSFLGNFVVQAWGARSSGLEFSLRIDLRDPDLRTYVWVTLPLVVGVRSTTLESAAQGPSPRAPSERICRRRSCKASRVQRRRAAYSSIRPAPSAPGALTPAR